ncbi:MAG: glutamine amidotransferase [Magnetococcales bacterium]|nr:glutamine amidotransferase [Magnetococcales bacterium]
MKTVYAIRHVMFEDLGSFAELARGRGYQIRYVEAGIEDLTRIDPLLPDLLVVLGGPIGVYEEETYPFITAELALLEKRLAADRPTLGICLGAQMMAKALGARVYSGPVKEIGWQPLTITPAGMASPVRHLTADKTSMLHWHGDTFDLPHGATLLASSANYAQQAFRWGKHALAFQCHPEIQGGRMESWLIGNTIELNKNGLSIPRLREETRQLAPALEVQGGLCLGEWLDGLPE